MEAVSAKRARAARRRGLEILQLRSLMEGSNGGEEESIINRKHDNDGFDAAEVSLSLSLSSSSPPSDLLAKNIPVPIGILLSRGEVFGDEAGNATCRAHGAVSVCGRRRAMEDAVTVAPAFVACGRYDFFGVYDGHGGCQVAQVCRDRLHQVLASEIESRGGGVAGGLEWREVMEAGFAKLDGEIAQRVADGPGAEAMDSTLKTVGSTAVVALVGAETVVVGNCGDSRAVMSRGGLVLPLSCDHKPNRPDEMQRVEAAGGRVINWDGYRVLGVLATSRSIGDHYLKPYVISDPEVTITQRTEDDEFLVLASDGLWDVVTNDTACNIVRKLLVGSPAPKKSARTVKRDGPAEAAAILVELAMSRGSHDNISVIVVDLRKSRL